MNNRFCDTVANALQNKRPLLQESYIVYVQMSHIVYYVDQRFFYCKMEYLFSHVLYTVSISIYPLLAQAVTQKYQFESLLEKSMLHTETNQAFSDSTSEQLMTAFNRQTLGGCSKSQSTTSNSFPRSIIHFYWHLLVSRCTFHTPFTFLVKWDNQFHPCMFYMSNKISALSTRCGIFKSSIRTAASVPEAGQQLKARRDQLVERSGISYSDHAKCQQGNLIICDLRVRRKSKEYIWRICRRASAKCQTNICWMKLDVSQRAVCQYSERIHVCCRKLPV